VTAYVVVDVESTDEAKAARYRELSGPSIERHGGRFLVRGGAMTVLEGAWVPNRVVIAEFPSVEVARQWYESDDYRQARRVREGAGTWNMVLVEGVDQHG
jgi:uncharacterized protein (DUF1330 family)